jgi:hypothetical protein
VNKEEEGLTRVDLGECFENEDGEEGGGYKNKRLIDS